MATPSSPANALVAATVAASAINHRRGVLAKLPRGRVLLRRQVCFAAAQAPTTCSTERPFRVARSSCSESDQ
uniref:Uncharacterized protein n=1 Tax=Oryza glaberrima TaxID=4538 RepID=I1QQX4_ORYGL